MSRAILLMTEDCDDAAASAVVTSIPIGRAAEELASAIRAIYCNSVRMLGDARYRDYGIRVVDGDKALSAARAGRNAWERLAIHLLHLKAPPDLYIRAQFEAFSKRRDGGLPFPAARMLYSEWAAENWQQFHVDRVEHIRKQLKSDQTQIGMVAMPLMRNLGWSERDALSYALTDRTGCVITPFTRFCVAIEQAINHIAVASFRSALVQYVFEAEQYDRALCSGVPAQLQTAACLIRAEMGL